MPNWLGRPDEDDPLAEDLVVSLRPSRALRAQSGMSTPNPAPESSGPVSRRNPSAPVVSSVTWAGAASRSAPSSAGNSLAAVPRPVSSSSSGCPVSCARAPTSQPYAGPGPHVRGGQHQARVIGRLERELDPPGTGIALATGDRGHGIAGHGGFFRFRPVGGRLDQAEAGADRAAG